MGHALPRVLHFVPHKEWFVYACARSRGRKAEKSRGRGAKMSQGQTQEQPLGGQPPKGQSALLKQEESGLICFTSFLFSSQVNSGATAA